jgi:hypothetical protein
MFRKLATLGVASVVGISLIGAGVGATFNQTTQSSQKIQVGTMNVTLSGAGALSNSDQTLTFATYGPTASTFTTGDQAVTITNNGDIPVLEIVATIGSSGDAALISQLYVCEVSSNQVIYNGLLSSAGSQGINGTLAAYPGPNNTDGYIINVYAGNSTTACGAVVTVGQTAVAGMSTAPSLTDAVQGKNATVSLTVTYSA